MGHKDPRRPQAQGCCSQVGLSQIKGKAESEEESKQSPYLCHAHQATTEHPAEKCLTWSALTCISGTQGWVGGAG